MDALKRFNLKQFFCVVTALELLFSLYPFFVSLHFSSRGHLTANLTSIEEFGSSMIVQYAIAYCIYKIAKWDKFKALIIADLISNIIFVYLILS